MTLCFWKDSVLQIRWLVSNQWPIYLCICTYLKIFLYLSLQYSILNILTTLVYIVLIYCPTESSWFFKSNEYLAFNGIWDYSMIKIILIADDMTNAYISHIVVVLSGIFGIFSVCYKNVVQVPKSYCYKKRTTMWLHLRLGMKKTPKQNRIIMIYNRKALLLNVLAIILFSLFSSLSVLGHQWSSLNMFYKIRIPFLHLRAAEPNGEIWHWYLVSLCCRGNCFTAMPRPPYCQPTQPPEVEFTQNIPNFCKYEDISSLNMFLNLYYHYKGKVYRIVLPFQQSSIASPQPPPCTDIEHRHHSDASPRRSDLVRTHSIPTVLNRHWHASHVH